MRANFLPALAVASAMAWSPAAMGAIASDNGGDPAYADGWQLTGGKVGTEVPPPGPDNGGSGFQTWVNAGSYTVAGWTANNPFHPAAHFIDTAPALAANDLGANAFTMSGQTNGFHGQTIGAVRPFAAALNDGETVSLDFDNPAAILGGLLAGVSFENAAGTSQVQLQVQQFSNNIGTESFEWYWQSSDTGGINDIGGADVASGLDTSDGTVISLTQLSSTTGTLVIDGASTNVTWSGGPLTQMRVFTQSLGAAADGSKEIFFNNLSIVPEPSAMLLMLLGAVGLAVRRLRRTIG